MATVVHKRVIHDIRTGTVNLKKEFGIHLAPETNNMYDVHFILPGPEDTPFHGGLYHGMIRLNSQHPISAPNIYMFTPSGRFSVSDYPINPSDRGICTTATSYHPETWTPVNNIETVLIGFISFMCDLKATSAGSIQTSLATKKTFAKKSFDYIKNNRKIKELFPELHESVSNGTYIPVNLSELSNSLKNENKTKTKKVKPEPESESEEESETESSSEEIVVNKKKSRKSNTRKKKIVESDSESSEEVVKKSKKKTSKKTVKKRA